jgi:mannose-1-phosphate guanylyltransferase
MFIWSVKAILNALKTFCPELHAMADAMTACAGTSSFAARLAECYEPLEKISIDYAVMENADNILMARGRFSWDDVGSWPALRNHFEADEAGNVVIGACERIDASGNIVVSEPRLTALIGVRDLVVVQAEGATLVCPRDRAQDVKQMVERLKSMGDTYEALL